MRSLASGNVLFSNVFGSLNLFIVVNSVNYIKVVRLLECIHYHHISKYKGKWVFQQLIRRCRRGCSFMPFGASTHLCDCLAIRSCLPGKLRFSSLSFFTLDKLDASQRHCVSLQQSQSHRELSSTKPRKLYYLNHPSSASLSIIFCKSISTVRIRYNLYVDTLNS